MADKIQNLEELLDRITEAVDDKQQITFGSIVESVGRRSFGPLLLLVGVILTSPLSGMPGVPTSMGIVVLLIAGQLLFKRKCCWLPHWMLRRGIETGKIHKAVKVLRSPASFVDRFLRPRLPLFIEGFCTYLISLVCAVIAIGMPMMELVPFSATGAGVALAAFGLALISGDGLLALLAFLVTGLTVMLLVHQLL